MRTHRRVPGIGIVAILLLAGACATVKKVIPGGEPGVKLVAGPELNVKSDGSALGTLHVRAYLLKDATGFRTLSYEDLWAGRKLDKDEAVLDMQEDVITPASDKKLSLKPRKGEEAKFIAVLAGYAQPDGDAAWRQVVDIDGKRNTVEITLGPRGMRPATVK
jgi:type VI secretion system VasD/TssJ family lipoprotein